MSDPLEPLKNVGEQLGKLAAELGLEMQTFMLAPGLGGGPDIVQAVFTMQELVVPSGDPDQNAFDAQFAEIAKEQARDDVRQKEQDLANEAARKALELRQRLQGGGSVLGD